MARRLPLLALAAGLTFGGLAGCNPPAEPLGQPYLGLYASPRNIDGKGQSTEITIEATDALGKPGTGTVTVSAPAGALGGGGGSLSVTLDAQGLGTASFACKVDLDAKCEGNVRLKGEWAVDGQTVTGTTVVVVAPVVIPPDAGPIDAGPVDAGTDAGVDAGIVFGDGGLEITTSRDTIFMGVGDFLEVSTDLGKAGEPVRFSATLGGFTLADGGSAASPLLVNTDSTGMANARFVETGAAGPVKITAYHEPSGTRGSASVEILQVREVAYDSTRCSGVDCTIMGIKGSGFQEGAQVRFKVVDSLGRPVIGIKTNFSISNAPAGTTVSPNAITDAAGMATANVSAGPIIGAITVKAVIIPGQVESESPTIGIRGAKASNKGFVFSCTPVNLGAYIAPTPPRSMEVKCLIKLIDRFNNPVGTGTPVSFKTEVGSIPNSVVTRKYDPSGTNAEEGTAEVIFSTLGVFPAVDVDPLPADAQQWPFPREAEPSAQDVITRNPRDGLVSIIAYVRGEEWFSDDNSDGTRSGTENFVDQGEPLVDSNDNGTWDPGEMYIDEAPADGQWNAPNGLWDNTTTIWAETRVLYTGSPSGSTSFLSPANFSGACPAGVAPNTAVYVYAYFADLNFNTMTAAGTTYTVRHLADKGKVSWVGNTVQDEFGFVMERRLLNPSNGQACTPLVPLCRWKMLFGSWGRGLAGGIQISGSDAVSTVGCVPDVATADGRVLNILFSMSAGGAIQ